MSGAHRWLLLGVALIAGLAGYFSSQWFRSPGQMPEDAAQVLLSASLPDLRGDSQPLAQWKGKVLVVNFWATWCPPCLKEIPEFIRMQDQLGEKGVQFVGIAIDDRDKVAEFAARMGINYPLLMGELEGIGLARRAGNRLGGLPFTVVIDRRGATAKVELGVLDEHKLRPILDALL